MGGIGPLYTYSECFHYKPNKPRCSKSVTELVILFIFLPQQEKNLNFFVFSS